MQLPDTVQTVVLSPDKAEDGTAKPEAPVWDIRVVSGRRYLTLAPMLNRVLDAINGSRIVPITQNDVDDALRAIVGGWRNLKSPRDGSLIDCAKDEKGRITDAALDGIQIEQIPYLFREFHTINLPQIDAPQKKD